MRYNKLQALLLFSGVFISATLCLGSPEEDIANAKKQISYVGNEMIKSEDTYRQQLQDLIIILSRSVENAQKSSLLDKLGFGKAKTTLKKAELINYYKNILQKGKLIKDSLSKLALILKDISEASEADIMSTFSKIESYFRDDKSFVEPYFVFAFNQPQIAKLDLKFSEEKRNELNGLSDKTFFSNFSIIPVQRGPRYQLLFGELQKSLKRLSDLTPNDKKVSQLLKETDVIVSLVKAKITQYNKLLKKL